MSRISFCGPRDLACPWPPGNHASDLIGISVIADNARNAAQLSPQDGGVTFSLSFGQIASPVSTFRWDGVAWTTDIIVSRLVWLAFALGIVVVSAFLFDRFDSSRGKKLRQAEDSPQETLLEETSHLLGPLRQLLRHWLRDDHTRDFVNGDRRAAVDAARPQMVVVCSRRRIADRLGGDSFRRGPGRGAGLRLDLAGAAVVVDGSTRNIAIKLTN